MKSEHTIYYVLLAFFLILALGSGAFLLKSTDQFSRIPALGVQHRSGTFRIETSQEAEVNTHHQVVFVADTNKQDVNAVQLRVVFDPTKIEILNVDTSESFCHFYPENRFDNVRGTLSIACGAPNPGFKGESRIAKVLFFTKSIGQTDITVQGDSLILLNDGKGTNVYSEPVVKTLAILNNI